MADYLTDIEIAQACKMRPIGEIAAKAGLTEEEIEPYGRYKAKVDLSVLKREKKKITEIAKIAGVDEKYLEQYGNYKAKVDYRLLKDLADSPDGKLILVTAITLTPAGEGKTTTSVGLTDGLRKIGKNAIVALREPSLGPVFGIKGGAAGGGYAQVVPMEDINLHFTGDYL